MNHQHQNLIERLKDIKNEINYITYKLSNNEESVNESKKLEIRLEYLCKIKNDVKNELIEHKNAYNDLDDLFSKEIKSAEKNLFRVALFTFVFGRI